MLNPNPDAGLFTRLMQQMGQQEEAPAIEDSADKADDTTMFASEEWQARESAYHQSLCDVLRQPHMYRALGLSGPPDRIEHSTLEDRISSMKVLHIADTACEGPPDHA